MQKLARLINVILQLDAVVVGFGIGQTAGQIADLLSNFKAENRKEEAGMFFPPLLREHESFRTATLRRIG
jgi:hypothetical protein